MGDPFLNYFALFLLIFVVVVLFYGIIAIHDIPHKIAESRHHPHQDAIYAAGWVSLFTLHALWPFLWIWSMAYRPERGWGFSSKPTPADPQQSISQGELQDLRRRIAELENSNKNGRDRSAREKIAVEKSDAEKSVDEVGAVAKDNNKIAGG